MRELRFWNSLSITAAEVTFCEQSDNSTKKKKEKKTTPKIRQAVQAKIKSPHT